MNELLAKYLSQNTSQEEEAEVLKWREDNPEQFFAFKQSWVSAKTYAPPLGGLSAIIGDIHETPVAETKSFPWLRYAATILVVIGLGLVGYNYLGTGFESELTTTVKLSDGSKVLLYKGAELEELSFEDQRVVSLTGLAYFDVARDEERPFIIYTSEAKVEVLGTSFTVDSEKEHTTEVIVESGLVSFSQNPDTYHGQLTSIKLRKGEKGLIKPEAKGIIKQNNRDQNFMAWANQELTFKMDKMSEVATLIDEVYGYEVAFENPSIRNCRLTAKYEQKTPDQLAKLIADTFGFGYEINDKQILFTGESCY